MSHTEPKDRQRLGREKDIQDIQEAANLAETAAQYFKEAEQAVREDGSARALARFAYQIQKSGLDTNKLFAEVSRQVEEFDHVTKEIHPDTDDLDWALADIAAWQFLSSREEEGWKSIKRIRDRSIETSALIHVGVKLAENKKDPTKWFTLAEQDLEGAVAHKENKKQKDDLIRCWAGAGNRSQVERLLKKFYPDNVQAQQKELIQFGVILLAHGVPVEDIFLNAFKEEAKLDHLSKQDLIQGLIATGHLNEAQILLMEPEGGDTPELEEAWEIFSKAQAVGDVETATSAFKVIASVGKIHSDLITSAGVALAKAGEEASANAMIALLDQEKTNLPPTKDHERPWLSSDQDQIRQNNILQFITRRRTESEKRELVGRFQQPLAAAVKDMLVAQIKDPRILVDGLEELAVHLAERGSQPNLFGVVDQIEKVVAQHPETFEEDTLPRLYLRLTKHTAAFAASHQGNVEIPIKYVEKVVAKLRTLGTYPIPPEEHLHEQLWAAKTRVAVAATKTARDRLTRGQKTKTFTSTQLNKLHISPEGQRLIATLRS